MSYSRSKRITWWALGSLLTVIVVYGVFRVYPLFAGPSITIYTPNDGDRVATTTVTLSGKALRAKEIRVQGRPITIGTDGFFTEELVVHAPYTILVVEAVDKYGKSEEKVLSVTPYDDTLSN
jgi:hypothetical protein